MSQSSYHSMLLDNADVVVRGDGWRAVEGRRHSWLLFAAPPAVRLCVHPPSFDVTLSLFRPGMEWVACSLRGSAFPRGAMGGELRFRTAAEGASAPDRNSIPGLVLLSTINHLGEGSCLTRKEKKNKKQILSLGCFGAEEAGHVKWCYPSGGLPQTARIIHGL